MRATSTARQRRAFTLAESLIAAVILAIATVGLCGMMAAASGQSSNTAESAVSMQLACALMEEIHSKPFDPPFVAVSVVVGSPKPARAFYDNVADYAGLVESSPFKDLGGNAIALDVPGTFRRSVTYTCPYLPRAAAQPASASSAIACVTVTVVGPSGKSVVLSRLFTDTADQ